MFFAGRISQPRPEHSANYLMAGLPQSLPVTHNKDSKIKIEMENRELWAKFHRNGTEMIITKTGR